MKPHPTYHVFYPGPTPVVAATKLIELNPDLAPINLATCMCHYRWVLKLDTVPSELRGHPEIEMWRRYYIALAAYGHVLAMTVAADPVLKDRIEHTERTYFSRMLAALDNIVPLRERPESERKPKFFEVPERIRVEETSVRVLANNPSSPVLALFPVYPLEIL